MIPFSEYTKAAGFLLQKPAGVELMLSWCFFRRSRRTLRGFQDIRRGAQPKSSPLLSMTFLYHQKLSLR